MDYEKIQAILNEVKPIVEENKKCRIEKWKNGDFFNIFSILKMETDEVKTHSAFLAELLNPKGSHGQGNIFIDEFVKNILHINNLDTKNADVTVEYSIGQIAKDYKQGGRIDILIRFHKPDFLILIENKIDAGDQPYQLFRYNSFAIETKKPYKLLYLTKDGHTPSELSIGEKCKKQYWDCISYSRNIKKWLTDCLVLIKSSAVAEMIKQYVSLINKITNQDMGSNMEEQLTTLMLNNLDETLIIMDNKAAFDYYIYDEFKDQMNKLAKECKCELKWEGEIWDSGTDQFIYFVPFSFPNTKIGFGKENGHEVFFYIENNKNENAQKLNCFSEDADKNYPYGWEWFKYNEWNSETIKAIHNGELKNYMKKCIEEILNDSNFPKN